METDYIVTEVPSPSLEELQELRHYGVKGMRWGFRRNKNGGYSRSGNRVKEVSEDAANAQAVRTKRSSKGIDSLSNNEIQALVTRMNLEQQLVGLDAKVTNKGMQFSQGLGKKFADQAGNRLVKESTNAIANAIIKKIKS